VALITYLYALLIDVLLIRLIPIFFLSIFEAKKNLKNCDYLKEADGNISDTARDLNEEELNLIGEFYETYDLPIVSLIESSSFISKGQRSTTV
jgi:hypothetical protein